MPELIYVSGGPNIQVYEDITFRKGTPLTPSRPLPPTLLLRFLHRAEDPEHFQVRFTEPEQRVMEEAGYWGPDGKGPNGGPKEYLRQLAVSGAAYAFEPNLLEQVEPIDEEAVNRIRARQEEARRRTAAEEAALPQIPLGTPENATYFCALCGGEHLTRTYVGRSHYDNRGDTPEGGPNALSPNASKPREGATIPASQAPAPVPVPSAPVNSDVAASAHVTSTVRGASAPPSPTPPRSPVPDHEIGEGSMTVSIDARGNFVAPNVKVPTESTRVGRARPRRALAPEGQVHDLTGG